MGIKSVTKNILGMAAGSALALGAIAGGANAAATLETTHEACNRDQVVILTGGKQLIVEAAPGYPNPNVRETRVESRIVQWLCRQGDRVAKESTTCPGNTNYVKFDRRSGKGGFTITCMRQG